MFREDINDCERVRIAEHEDTNKIPATKKLIADVATGTNRWGLPLYDSAKVGIISHMKLFLMWYYRRYYGLVSNQKPAFGKKFRFNGITAVRERGGITVSMRGIEYKYTVAHIKQHGQMFESLYNEIASSKVKKINHPVRDPNKPMSEIMKELRENSIRNSDV